MKRLPDAEFEVMKAVWALPIPCSAGQVLQALQGEKEWKVQTVITLLSRLVERGFLSTEKQGKERLYRPLLEKEAYLQFETGNFIRQYHGNSFTSFVTALYDGETISDADADELMQWLKERKS